MFNTIQTIAKANPYGFTYNIKSNAFVQYGYVVSYAATQDSFGDEGLRKVIEHALQHNGIVGGWLNSENGKYYYDSCRVFKRKSEALEFGRQQKQLAIFDLTNLAEIRL